MPWFKRLCELGPAYGYYPSPAKSIIVTASPNLVGAFDIFSDLGFPYENIRTGARYLGGYIGEDVDRNAFVSDKVEGWVAILEELSIVGEAYPQSAYTAYAKSFQHQLTYAQRVIPHTDALYEPLDKVIHDLFLPSLFGNKVEEDDHRHQLAGLPVRFNGLGVEDPSKTANPNFQNSMCVAGRIVVSMRGILDFDMLDHAARARETRQGIREASDANCETRFKRILQTLTPDLQRTLQASTGCGGYLTVVPTVFNGTELACQEFRDNINIRYGIEPPDLQPLCDGCGAKFSVTHSQECKKGGLIHLRHDEIKGAITHLASKAFSPSSIRDEPKIHQGRPVETDAAAAAATDDFLERADTLIRGYYKPGKDALIDFRVVNLDSKSYRNKKPEKVLEQAEREKNKKYLEACRAQRRDFVPFVVSTTGLIGKEGQFFLKRLAIVLAQKHKKEYSAVCGYVKAYVSVAIARSVHYCLRGSRVPTTKMSSKIYPQWEDGAGMLQ